MEALNNFVEQYWPIKEKIDLKSILFSRTSLVFSSTLMASYLFYRSLKPRYSVVPRWPPGPTPWPIIGNMLEMKASRDKRVIDKIQALAAEYGDMVHLHLGMRDDLVILSSTDLIYEAFVKKGDVFSNRGLHLAIMKERGHEGILLQHGEKWRKIKTFTVSTLKDLGTKNADLPCAIQDEVDKVMRVFLSNAETPFKVECALTIAVGNVISSVVFNERFEQDDEEFRNILSMIGEYFATGGATFLARTFLPCWILNLFSPQMQRNDYCFKSLKSFVREMIDKHRLDFDENNMRDFTDYYLKIDLSNDENKISENNMFRVILDLFLAGTETTSTTLNWMILYLIRHQDIQQKCRNEIHKIVGTSRSPTLKYRGSLPYTEAMIQETQRLANIAPMGASHCTSKPVELGGYYLPEETLIIANFAECMTTDRYWEDPLSFKPERWLNKEGTALKKEIPKSFIPFSIGPRTCPGDNLAKMELFIFSTNLIQKLKFDAEDVNNLPKMKGLHKATVVPVPYKTIISAC